MHLCYNRRHDKGVDGLKKIIYPLLLFITATIWGFAFVAQSVGMDYVEPFTFTAARSVIGGLVLLPLLIWKKGKKKGDSSSSPQDRALLLKGGLACGLLLFLASSLQQIGIQYTSVGKAGFITTFYIIVVPFFAVFSKQKVHPLIWPVVALALVGLYLLTMDGSFALSKGDAYILACAFMFGVHIMVIDHFTSRVDGVWMSCIQFFVCGILAFLVMMVVEEPNWAGVLAAWGPILYAGVMSNGVAYTLQIVGQKGVHPTVASLILSLESGIAVLGGWLILGEVLTAREGMGCLLLFVAILAAQLLPQGKGSDEASKEELLGENI